jgi:hypothetical protein
MQLVERTRALDAAFSERLALFDHSMMQSAAAIDSAVSDKARALTAAMEGHVRALSDTLGHQISNIDQSMLTGIESVRRSSDSITRQSLKAIEGLNSQADVLRGVSETLAHQISGAPSRFDTQVRSTAGAQSQAVAAEYERMRAQADAQTMRAIQDMRSEISAASHDMPHQSAPLLHEQDRLRPEGVPIATRESAEAMRSALNDQLRALEQLSSLAARREAASQNPLAPGSPMSLTASYAAQAGMQQPTSPPPQPHQPPPPQPPQAPPQAAAMDGGERWSLGDLLARASYDDDGTQHGPMLDLESISRAVDPTTASAIWSRFRAGQRGIMVRSIYTAEGRSSFDDVTERYGRDMDFRRTVDRFLADFERLVRETEQKSPRAVHDHLVSDAGRVYLFLAHASGRLR